MNRFCRLGITPNITHRNIGTSGSGKLVLQLTRASLFNYKYCDCGTLIKGLVVAFVVAVLISSNHIWLEVSLSHPIDLNLRFGALIYFLKE